ncbi:MAG: DUF1858 domain-containing protein [Myxococcota bacterium]
MTDHEPTRPDITPLTKIADLLEAYPELETVLIETAPVFARLRNPVLRGTVAKVATIERAAGIVGISVRDLVLSLRRASGLSPVDALPSGPRLEGAASFLAPPSWVKTGAVVEVFDVDAMLDAGQVPLGPVFRRARKLRPGELVRVLSSFLPTPLSEKLGELGHPVHSVRTGPEGSGGFHTHIGPRPDPS